MRDGTDVTPRQSKMQSTLIISLRGPAAQFLFAELDRRQTGFQGTVAWGVL